MNEYEPSEAAQALINEALEMSDMVQFWPCHVVFGDGNVLDKDLDHAVQYCAALLAFWDYDLQKLLPEDGKRRDVLLTLEYVAKLMQMTEAERIVEGKGEELAGYSPTSFVDGNGRRVGRLLG